MENINTTSEIPVQSFTTQTSSTQQKNIYKLLFFIFFILFLVVTSVLITLLMTKSENQPIVSTKNESSSDDSKIINAVKLFCEKDSKSVCQNIAIIDKKEYFVVAKDEKNTKYLLTRSEKSEWDVAIASEEDDICSTGSGSSVLYEYCSNR